MASISFEKRKLLKKIVIRLNAPVILTFALLSLLALLLGNWTDGAATYWFSRVPLLPVRSADVWWFFGHVLGHADYEHYMSNMLLILLVGPGMEEKYGQRYHGIDHRRHRAGHGSGAFIFFPASVLLGASGVVFMMIVLSSFTAMRRGEIPITLILVVVSVGRG